VDKRAVIVYVPGQLLASLCKTGNVLCCTEGVPKDAVFDGADYDFARDAFALRFVHLSYCPTPEGSTYPAVEIILQEIQPDKVD
jgi:hypothetical protein